MGLGFDRNDAAGVEVVEAEAEGCEIGGEVGVEGVEEDVFLKMGFEVVGRLEVVEVCGGSSLWAWASDQFGFP